MGKCVGKKDKESQEPRGPVNLSDRAQLRWVPAEKTRSRRQGHGRKPGEWGAAEAKTEDCLERRGQAIL